MKGIIRANTFSETTFPLIRTRNMGVEVEEYQWTNDLTDARAIFAKNAAKLEGVNVTSLHGTCLSRDFAVIRRMTRYEKCRAYNVSFAMAELHGTRRLVFHSDYFASMIEPEAWVEQTAGLFSDYLRDKPANLQVFLENFIDDTPELLKRVVAAVGDPRFGICLDTGHANCNSPIPLNDWITTLGDCIRHVHLHNNDGSRDWHWPLNRGTLDFRTVLPLLSQCASASDWVLECDLPQSLDWLKANQM